MASRAYRLQADESADDGLRRIARGRAERASSRLDGAGGDEHAAAIHGARKDLKKLRSLLRLVRRELGEDVFAAESKRYRDAGRLLAGSRDAEVRLQTLVALRVNRESTLPAADTALWESQLEAERDEIVAAAEREAGQIERARKKIAAGHDRVGSWPLRGDTWKLAEPGLRRGYRDGRRAMKRVRKDSSAENVHRWRKRTKDLWYQLRIVRNAWPQPLDAAIDQAHELADLLGDHHDLAVLREDLASRWGVSGKAAFETAIGQRQQELLATALELGARIYAEKPQAFSRRLEAYWLAWRDN